MTVLDLFDDRFQLALQFPGDALPNTSAILLAVMRHRPISQPRSKILWTGKLRLKMKLRQYSTWLTAWKRSQ